MAPGDPTPWKVPGKWSLSPHAFAPEVRTGWEVPPRVTVHDVTLRDGEQTPGVVFRKPEKLRIAHALEEAGVRRIEGGMVATSDEDFDALATMAREMETAEVCGFCRARRDDLERAVKAGLHWAIMEITALDPIIHNIWGSRGRAVEEIVGLTRFAKAEGLKVCFFLMESARTPLELIEALIVPVVTEGGADTVAIVDTRGSAYPTGFAWQIAQVRRMVPVPVEVHCHNNWGLSTANTLAAVTAGAEVVHTCVNGMGGNAPLDEIVLGIEAFLKCPTGMRSEGFRSLAALVRSCAGPAGAEWYKPFTGSLTSQVEVGIATRQMWDRRHEPGYGRAELLNYEIVGGKAIEVALGKKSGRYSILLKAWELGLPEPTEAQAAEILERIKAVSEAEKRLVTEEEFRRLYDDTRPASEG